MLRNAACQLLVLSLVAVSACSPKPAPDGANGASDPATTASYPTASADSRPSTPAASHPSGPKLSPSGYDITPLATSDDEWRAQLTQEQFDITRRAGTEPPFHNEYWDNKKAGIYVSRCGGLPLFSSDDKFRSGTGWPSFTQPIDPAHIIEKTDYKIGYARTEILDARSGAHLGHVFEDGPPPTGKRYCLNSAALRFIPEGEPLPPESKPVR